MKLINIVSYEILTSFTQGLLVIKIWSKGRQKN